MGTLLFQQHCAGCHGNNAQATPNWKQTDANGHYPPPPLDGSAHAWHHDLPLLQKTVREGGQKLGGQMPPFASVLNAAQIDSVIAYFQSHWTDELYSKWALRFNITRASVSPGRPKESAAQQPDLSYLKQRLGNSKIGIPELTPVNFLFRIPLEDKFLYLTEDGQYAIIGDMIDLKNGINLSNKK
jgi:hypothetical protein